MIIDYFDLEPVKKEIIGYDENDEPIYDYSKSAVEFPTLAGFAVSIGVWRQRLWEWGKQYAAFSDALKIAKSMQENILIVNGMAGRYDTSFAKLAAKNLCAWSDKSEITSPDDSLGTKIYNYNNLSTEELKLLQKLGKKARELKE
jgi:hypothetical protein